MCNFEQIRFDKTKTIKRIVGCSLSKAESRLSQIKKEGTLSLILRKAAVVLFAARLV